MSGLFDFFKNKNDNIKRSSEEQLADIANEFVRQNKSKRRWRILLSLLFFGYIVSVSYVSLRESGILQDAMEKESPFVAEVLLSGVIQSTGGINADDAIELLQEAFEAENAKAVILRLNSPGGSPVQSSRIYKAINRLKAKFDKKLYVVAEDVCASGCYYIAAAADEIYTDESSIIGSIGVVMSSFGVVDAMKKIGIERRLYTAGKNKGLGDMFLPEDEATINHIQTQILDKSHQNFINAVKEGRGDRLKDNKDLFTGLVWLGQDAYDLGLIDGIGDANFVATELVGVKTRILYEKEKTLLEELTEASAKNIALVISNQFFSKSWMSTLQ
ncbi:Peptidase S49 [uncultured Gammaproteobacteria bacterium]|jgi:protease-4|uniref:S49 family peptidase n=1 Tax=thiotrophic endosymbiont of Bathymodiolus puteoserpentis (Logatchev) TaxID=343240 RepID=UPI0010B9C4F5|nr:S49 family peptidase [thiotrophic endosymbiont of Bathymodiolus puteoserpentis (Logatchev)]CAC9584651.1 Periplasmic serine proteases (ClpP class) [uncultured Gammaproteobacteria bacterium]CAC9651413.1 Periplasmic serine proteases (ClpP class) [uncultured Gammaproteobacteria bacterium]CAC9965534.1 Peptidase S49 [uncultured Gammaproteobacteria bacterium]SSC10105.1 Peptidase S49 [thiotrophic endosymbiont of Bathymodiolus puteoserpentis (Logatchev)]VVH51453.1 Peptidase S49 [uncultured Gammaprot